MYLTLHVHLLICIALSQLMQRRGTALHAACKHGHVEVASLLLHHGAVLDIKDKVRLLYVSMVNMMCHRIVSVIK